MTHTCHNRSWLLHLVDGLRIGRKAKLIYSIAYEKQNRKDKRDELFFYEPATLVTPEFGIGTFFLQ